MSESREGSSPIVPVALLASLAAIALGNRNVPFELTRPLEPSEAAKSESVVPSAPVGSSDDPLLGVPRRVARLSSTESIEPAAERTVCVTLETGDTQQASESRRRTRYAVHAAMTAHGYRVVDLRSLRLRGVADVRGFVPFEDFVLDRSPLAPGNDARTRVYWIDERLFSSPGRAIGEGMLRRIGDVCDGGPATIIGPSTSAVFAAMQSDFTTSGRIESECDGDDDELCGPMDAPPACEQDERAAPLIVYSPWATRFDGDWKGAIEASYGAVTVRRTIADDRFVASALVEELSQRGIDRQHVRWGKPDEARGATPPSSVLLLIERDSDFARAWKGYLEEAWIQVFGASASGERPCFEVAYFSRGLDGRLAGRQTTGPESIEAPDGRASLDYLRRLRASLPRRQILAVGVFAEDVHDKLLVLQALRPLMSEAVFFTNDLDAWFGHPKTAKYTRNLVVASAFDLLPSHECAHSRNYVTPFRNQYQTATYHAVVRAIDDDGDRDKVALEAPFRKSDGGQPSSGAEKKAKGIRLFEITNGGAEQLTPIAERNGVGCPTTLVVTYAMLLLFAGLVATKRVFRSFVGLPWLRAILILAFLLPVFLAAIVTCVFGPGAWGDEPFSLTDGISVWPTEMLRLLSYYLALVFGAGLMRSLRRDYCAFAARFALTEDVWCLPWPCSKRRSAATAAAGGAPPRASPAGVYPRPEVGAAISLLIAIVVFSSVFAVMRLTGLPHVPARGDLARVVDRCVMIASVVAMLWLLFLVAGTNFRMTLAIARVGDPSMSAAAAPSKRHASDPKLLSRARFLETIARLGGGYIYGPFVVMLVLIMSRWRAIDDWSWPPLLIGVIAFSVAIGLTASFVLTHAARKYRRKTVERIDRLVRDEVGAKEEHRTNALDRLRREIVALDTGIFAGVGGHPAVRALLIPLSGVGGLSLLPLVT